MDNCLFCDILANKRPASLVYRDEFCTAFLDIRPINPGHVLIVPNQHAACLAELEENTGAQLFRVAQRIATALRNSDIPCEGVNLFLADGAAAGQEVFHTHLHLFPRVSGDGFRLNIKTKHRPSTEALNKTAEKIRIALA